MTDWPRLFTVWNYGPLTGATPDQIKNSAFPPTELTIYWPIIFWPAFPVKRGLKTRESLKRQRTYLPPLPIVISETLKLTGGNRSKAAKFLGLSRPTLHSRIEKYGIKFETSVTEDPKWFRTLHFVKISDTLCISIRSQNPPQSLKILWLIKGLSPVIPRTLSWHVFCVCIVYNV